MNLGLQQTKNNYSISNFNQMKNINLFLVFILSLVVFSGCKKEDEEPTPKEQLENKTWVVTSSDTEILTPLGTLPDSLTNDFDPTQGIEGQTIIFNTDGTFVVGEGDNQQQGNWTLSEDGSTLTFTGLVEGELTDFIDAETLASLQTFEVTSLTDTQLAIQNSTNVTIPAEIAEQITGFAFPITLTVNLTINFSKQ